jgi:hypothetical protein
MGGSRLDELFGRIVGLEFHGEEVLRLGWIVRHAMLDDARDA